MPSFPLGAPALETPILTLADATANRQPLRRQPAHNARTSVVRIRNTRPGPVIQAEATPIAVLSPPPWAYVFGTQARRDGVRKDMHDRARRLSDATAVPLAVERLYGLPR